MYFKHNSCKLQSEGHSGKFFVGDFLFQMEFKGRELLYIQIILFGLLFFLGNVEVVVKNILLLIPFLAGTIIIFYSMYVLGPRSFSPFPFPPKNSVLVKRGPYSQLRHPMYFGMEIVGLTLVLSNLRFESVFVFLFLIYVLNMKADMEEEELSKKFPEYSDYRTKTRKLVPYFF